MTHALRRLLLPLLLLSSAPVAAEEIWAGLFAHNVDLPTTIGSPEGGLDLQAGVRSAPFARVLGGELRAGAYGSVNLDGGLGFAAAGILLRFPLDDVAYIQPGIGLAVHNGPGARFSRTDDRLYPGSRLLFAPELALGFRLGPVWAAEFGWVHLSHAKQFSGQNPGLDDLGVRLVYRFGR